MSQRGRFIAFGLALAVAATGLRAQSPEADQPPASLIADEVTYDRETGLLVATGDVEVL